MQDSTGGGGVKGQSGWLCPWGLFEEVADVGGLEKLLDAGEVGTGADVPDGGVLLHGLGVDVVVGGAEVFEFDDVERVEAELGFDEWHILFLM